MQAPDRSIFLHKPEPYQESRISNERQPLSTIIQRATKYLFQPEMPREEWNSYLIREATSSAAIENEFRELQLDRHYRALGAYIKKPLTQDSLRELHQAMMTAQLHAQPGRYRTVGVIVGRYCPPAPELVPPLMEELFDYLQERNHDPLVQAAWAHIQFETIHPFADGNGRTGRALISRILGNPLPISEEILEDRQRYYQLLDSGDWEQYWNWFFRITTQATMKAILEKVNREESPKPRRGRRGRAQNADAPQDQG